MEENINFNENESGNTFSGYKIIIVILAVVIVAISILFYLNVSELKQNKASLTADKELLESQLTTVVANLDSIQTTNVEINRNLELERHRADSLLTKLRAEQKWSYNKIKSYEKELGTLREVMKGYVQQIKELNETNKKLADENVRYQKEIKTATLRADVAEEQSEELTAKIRQGSVIQARELNIIPLRGNREVSRIGRAENLKIELMLVANTIAIPGNRTVYARVIGPDGYALAKSEASLFTYQDSKITYTASREVDYQGKDLNVSLYYACEGLSAGKYTVEIYLDGYKIGTKAVEMK